MSKKNKGIIKFFTGLIIGIGIGLAIDNFGVGTAIGIALGAGLSQSKIAWIFLHTANLKVSPHLLIETNQVN